jgi:hypothetical protein
MNVNNLSSDGLLGIAATKTACRTSSMFLDGGSTWRLFIYLFHRLDTRAREFWRVMTACVGCNISRFKMSSTILMQAAIEAVLP